MNRRCRNWRLITFVWIALCAIPAIGLSQTLPLQTGPINDYAAVLGGKPQREPLHQLINQIQEQFNISVTVLVSERNPFQTIEQYGAEIRRAWNLTAANTVLALYVKQNERWSFDLWLGSSAQFKVNPGGLNQLINQVSTQTKRVRLRNAVTATLEGLLELLEAGNTESNIDRNDKGFDLNWWMGMIGLPGIALLGTLRWLRSYCPHCVKRLTRGSSKSRPYCRRCGFRR